MSTIQSQISRPEAAPGNLKEYSYCHILLVNTATTILVKAESSRGTGINHKESLFKPVPSENSLEMSELSLFL